MNSRSRELAGTMPISLRLTSDGAERVAPSVRVMSPEIAVMTRDAMADVAEKLDKTIRDFGYGNQTWSYDMFGKSVFIFEGVSRDNLAALGELRTPSVADLFVATMKGGEK